MNPIDVLKRREVAVAAARSARDRRGDHDDPLAAGLPLTFAMPGEEEKWRAAAAAMPATRWVQRPAATVPGVCDIALPPRQHPQRDGRWVVQEDHEPSRVGGLPCVARWLVHVPSLDPLVVLALEGPVRARVVDAGSRVALEPSAGAPAAAIVAQPAGLDGAALGVAMRRLAADIVIGARETLMRLTIGCDEPVTPLLGVVALLDTALHPWLLEVETDPLVAWQLTGPVDVASFRRLVPSAEVPTLSSLALPRPGDVSCTPRAAKVADLVPAPGLRAWGLGDELAVHTSRGALHVLDPVPTYVWTALEEGLDPEAIAVELADALSLAADTTRTQVWSQLGSWVEAGLLITGPTPPRPTTPHPPAVQPGPVAYVRWNAARAYRCAGRTVSVRAPDERIAEWVHQAVAGLAESDPTQVWAFSEISWTGTGWTVTSTCHAPLQCRSEHQLPPLVRWSVLVGALRTTERAVVGGTVLAIGAHATVVVGAPADRAALAMEWITSGGRLLADEIITLDGVVDPESTGIQLWADYQWVDSRPPPAGSPGAPVIGRDGWLTRYWRAPPSVLASAPLPPGALVVLDSNAGADPVRLAAGTALRYLLAARPPHCPHISAEQAAALVRSVRTMPAIVVSPEQPRHLARILRSPGAPR